MKEQIQFNNVAIEQSNNVVRLTSQPFGSKLGREGGIFMSEPGQSEIPTGGKQKPVVNRPYKPIEHSQSVPPTPEEKARQLQGAETIQELLGPLGTPEFDRGAKDLAEAAAGTPEQPMVKEKREESKGVVAYNQGEPPFDPTRFTADSRLQEIAEHYREIEFRTFRDPTQRLGLINDLIGRLNNIRDRRGEIVDSEAINQAQELAGNLRAGLREAMDSLARGGEIRTRTDRLRKNIYDKLDIPEGATQGEIKRIIAGITPEMRSELANDMKRHIRTLQPSGSQLDPELVDLIIETENYESLEYIINRIISHPLEAETKRYAREFYGGINFSLITESLKGKAEDLRTGIVTGEAEERPSLFLEGLYRKFHTLEAGTEFMHNLNRTVVMGAEREFVGLAPEMIPDHFQVLQRAKHVPAVMRIFDEELQRVMARDSVITAKNYKEVTGTIFDEEGGVTGAIEGSVEKLLRAYNEKLPASERLDEWEIKWAFHTGRNLLNITIRTAELIAHSSGAQIGYKSFPQESIAKIIDQLDLLGERFGVAQEAGGIQLLHMIKANFHREKEHHGWRESGIKTILGKNRKKFEETGILNITGVFSSWRQNNILFLNVPGVNHATDEPQRISIENFLNYNNLKIGDLDAQNVEMVRKLSRLGLNQQMIQELKQEYDKDRKLLRVSPQALRGIFIQENGELRSHFNHSLGALLRLSEVTPDEKDSRSMLDAKRAVRIAIWKKIASDNPLAMASILYGMELDGNEELNNRLKAIGNSMYITKNEMTGEKEDTPLWAKLREKLTVAQEIRMRSIAEGRDMSFDEALTQLQSGTPQAGEGLPPAPVSGEEGLIPAPIEGAPIEKPSEGAKLSAEEVKLLEQIRNVGKRLVGNLAEVRFPSNPIMNDVLFETADYSEAGTEFYKRRTGSDLVSFYEGGGGLTQLISNPGALTLDQAKEILGKVVKSLGDPNGLESAQNDVAPILEGYIDFTREGGPISQGRLGQIVSFAFKEGMLVNGVKRVFRRPTSLAQKYIGPFGSTHNIYEIRNFLDQALQAEILRKGINEEGRITTDLYERFRKKFKVKGFWMFLAFLRDMFPIAAAGFLVKTGEESATTKT